MLSVNTEFTQVMAVNLCAEMVNQFCFLRQNVTGNIAVRFWVTFSSSLLPFSRCMYAPEHGSIKQHGYATKKTSEVNVDTVMAKAK